MKKIELEIKQGLAPIHLKSLIKKEKPTYLTKVRNSKIFKTETLQLDLFYKSPL